VNEKPIRDFRVLLSPTPRGARLARLLATEQLRDWGLPLDPARLIVAELATNAATHGRVPGRSFQLRLRSLGGTLRIEVTDTRGDRLPRLRPAGAGDPRAAEAGRGLTLVAALADGWGVIQGPPPRKTVWAELTFSAPNPPAPATPFSGVPRSPHELPTGEKAPHQTPPLPPAAAAHSAE
jgi:anti-sigma regulatory factor (Ser/Thr protein kinase)